jgi:nicotinate-nucleotide adenylyltransferase
MAQQGQVGWPDAARAFGMLGGTFDPIHLGHLAVAREAHAFLDLDYVLFIPNGIPPHKRQQEVAAASHREAMVRLAIEGEPDFHLSRLELERPGPSFAVDTVAALADVSLAEGRPEPWFILSAEAVDDFDAWHEPGRILDLCRVAVAPRPGAERLDRDWLASRFPGRDDRFALLPGPSLDIASTAVRERIRQGQAIEDLVPEPVGRYIAAHGLYLPTSQPGRRPAGTEAAKVAPADPRGAERPGLPASRAGGRAAPARPGIPAAVDESTLRMAHRVVELASDKKASDIVLLDVRGQTTMTDYFVICSGASERQLDAIADGIVEGIRHDGEAPLSREGIASSHWVLIDFGGVIVHVMSVPERDFYQLEKLWAQASLLLHVV